MKRELPPTAGVPPHLRDLFARPRQAFTAWVAQRLRTPEVILTTSGSAALVIAFEYLKTLSARRTVILPAYTCPLVAFAVARAGLKVAVCDTLADRFDLDLDQLRHVANDDTLALIPTHFGGHVTQVSELCAWRDTHAAETFVIEDAAQAFGASAQGAPVGFAGDIGLFSFAAGKGLTLYEGGCLVSPSARHRQALAALAARLQPVDKRMEARRIAELIGYYLFYTPATLPYVYGWPRRRKLARGDVIGALGDDLSDIPMHQVGAWRQRVAACASERYEASRAMARGAAQRLKQALQAVSAIKVHTPEEGDETAATFLFVTCADKAMAERIFFHEDAQALGVSKLFALTLTDYPALKGIVPDMPVPQAAALVERTLTITTTPFLTDEHVERIVRLFQSG
ncbi:DegT/DnrJ/EryC1/StrS family aminotransferase [Methylovirgula sp. 4M-Z18]|uniref:DegT/DnrJ/EryC1/StrS family aminotransferase n=1 Tax=Methylovirgula sp. 4M-Z18 TaxID=2293567 RepID=UPI000E2F8814|nr:DegT/DnrJ/EryC1/StrS family aminotransferase [Methylovirgula sp. 4M-Z18]RFB81053.1 DegT/DnrJ/EryC1/StrS aminotransferase family protein [Methylovirgula sp. 4M-Z18]